MGKWIDLLKRDELRQAEIDMDHLKYELACARQRESDLRAANAYETEIWEKRYNELKSENSDLKFEVMTLKNSSSRKHFESTMEKLKNVTSKLINAESRIRDLESQVAEMQKFIDTLPDGFRGAWSMYLMTKKDKEKDND